MNILNIHSRELPKTKEHCAPLIDGLASDHDSLWPSRDWPPMRLKHGLKTGSSGGHGPIRYSVEQYRQGEFVCFRFSRPAGFIGTHQFMLEDLDNDRCKLTHLLKMEANGFAQLSWPIVFRPMHDALIEDALDRAESFATGSTLKTNLWSPYVIILRWLLRKTKRV